MKIFAKATDSFVSMVVPRVCSYSCSLNWKEFSGKISLIAAFSGMRIWGWQVCHYKSFRMLCILYLFPPPVVYLFIGSLHPLRRGSSFLEVFSFLKKLIKSFVSLRSDLHCCTIS